MLGADADLVAALLATQLVLALYGAGLRRPFGSVETVTDLPLWLRQARALTTAADIGFVLFLLFMWQYLFLRMNVYSFLVWLAVFSSMGDGLSHRLRLVPSFFASLVLILFCFLVVRLHDMATCVDGVCAVARTGFEALGILTQAACLWLVWQDIVRRPSASRMQWTATSAALYAGTLLAVSRPGLAAVLTELLALLLMRGFDSRDALRQLFARQVSIGAVSRWLVGLWAPEFETHDWKSGALMLARFAMLLVFAAWEPRIAMALPDRAPIVAFTLPLLAALGPLVPWLLCGALIYAIARRLVRTEASLADLGYAASFAAVVFAAVLLPSLRPAFAALAALLTTVCISRLSALKFRYTGLNLHAYDVVHFLRNRSSVLYLGKTTGSIVSRPGRKLIAGLVVLVILAVFEPAAIGRVSAAGILALAVAAFVATRRALVPWTYTEHLSRPTHVAHFSETIFDALRAYRRGGIVATEPAAPDMPELSRALPALKRDGSEPTIVLILNESTFPPSLYCEAASDPAMSAFFRSADGRARGLRVEVFGGVSWRTEFSVLTGIPVSCYGAFGGHVFHWATDRIHRSLPQYLKQRGYKTAVLYPIAKEFIGCDKFYRSIGFDEIRDRAVSGARSDQEPDAFYFDQVLKTLDDHSAVSEGPSFIYMLTMSNHFPHSVRLTEAGGALQAGPLPDTELDEYMRRLRRTCRDYAGFRAALAARFPARKFLVVHFGDHQPPFTAQMSGRSAWKGTPEDLLPCEEIAYRTYFAIDGVNFEPHIAPDMPDTVEVAYLGTVTLAAAGIPLDPVHALRRDLMMRHAGRLFFADEGGRIAAQVNQRMLESGLISPH